jgi:3-mercaptopyruvate sulfurtransferase SseA
MIRSVMGEIATRLRTAARFAPQEETSARAALQLRRQGLSETWALLGGFLKWMSDGNPIANDRDPADGDTLDVKRRFRF